MNGHDSSIENPICEICRNEYDRVIRKAFDEGYSLGYIDRERPIAPNTLLIILTKKKEKCHQQ